MLPDKPDGMILQFSQGRAVSLEEAKDPNPREGAGEKLPISGD